MPFVPFFFHVGIFSCSCNCSATCSARSDPIPLKIFQSKIMHSVYLFDCIKIKRLLCVCWLLCTVRSTIFSQPFLIYCCIGKRKKWTFFSVVRWYQNRFKCRHWSVSLNNAMGKKKDESTIATVEQSKQRDEKKEWPDLCIPNLSLELHILNIPLDRTIYVVAFFVGNAYKCMVFSSLRLVLCFLVQAPDMRSTNNFQSR